MEPFLGMIAMFGFSFAPRGWALCSGQLLAISSNSALFSLLGTTYGGNGTTTFALPDLRGRVAIGQGQGPGLSNYVIGQVGGAENTTLNVNQMPAHTHAATVTAQLHGETAVADKRNPLGAMLATPPAASPIYADPVPAEDKLMAASSIVASATIQPAGNNQPFSNIQPCLAVNYCIALEGIFPSRN